MAQFGLRPNIILLRDGTDSSQGKPQIISNINACCAVVDIVKSTLGPRGMDKLMVDEGGEALVTNDGATVMKRLNVVHPAAKILVDIAKSQDMEVGDGTTSVVVLCGEFLREAKTFLEDGVVAQTIIKGYRKAAELALQKLKDISIDLSTKDPAEKTNMLRKCAETTLNSKLVADYKEFFSEMVVRAIQILGDDLDYRGIGIKKVTGGSVMDSTLINGVAFKKTFSYAGFEQQPKSFVKPKILLLNLELELKSEKDNAEIRIADPSKFQAIVDAEWNIIYEKLDNIAKSGANVVLSKLAIGDLATQYFADRDIFCAGRVEHADLDRTRRATGAAVQTTVTAGLDPSVLGSCGKFEEVQIGAERWNLFKDCENTKAATLIIRGGAQQFVDEAERSIHDSFMIVKSATKNTAIVGGGGAIEMELSRYLREYARTVPGKQQRVIENYARALEVIPRTLVQNSGGDATDVMNKLRQKHTGASSTESRWFGVDCIENGVKDTLANFIWEPTTVKENAIYAATEACNLILSIDETIKNPQSEQPKGGKGKGGGKGFTNQMAGMARGGKGRGMKQLRNTMA
ncbi:unnamed protein product [Amoebophrya sp. A120]|nr:unnamed protein product [Amoebophrya sp. A120]|eukprot:GSA120T00008220001.1